MGGPHLDDDDLPLSGSLMGFATTPPWHVSQLQQPESAMRSTQSAIALDIEREHYVHDETPQPPSPPQPFVGHHIHPDNLQYPGGSHLTWTPINQYPFHKQPVNNHAFYGRYQRIVPRISINMHEYDTVQEMEDGVAVPVIDRTEVVDTEDDRVYHAGHIRGETYSGTFKDDDPAEIPLEAVQFIKEMNRKREEPERLKRSIALLQMATKFVEAGRKLVLERTSFVDCGEAVLCMRKGCQYEQGMPPDRYYLEMDWNESYRFCLECFERLWKGHYTNGLIDYFQENAPTWERRDSVMDTEIPQCDGISEITQSGLSASRWAVPGEELAASANPVRTPERKDTTPDDDVDGSPNSVMSNMQWRHPPTRFQNIGETIEPGGTLSGADKNALLFWKSVSWEQTSWEIHARRTKHTRDFYDEVDDEDQSLKFEPRQHQVYEDLDKDALGAELGLRRREIHGTDLSEVLKKVAEMKR